MTNTQLNNFTAQNKWHEDSIEAVATHSGQKRAYGDSYYEYEVTSELPPEEVEKWCSEKLHKAIPQRQWKDEDNSMCNHFRPYYNFAKREGGKYFYQVINSYAD